MGDCEIGQLETAPSSRLGITAVVTVKLETLHTLRTGLDIKDGEIGQLETAPSSTLDTLAVVNGEFETFSHSSNRFLIV